MSVIRALPPALTRVAIRDRHPGWFRPIQVYMMNEDRRSPRVRIRTLLEAQVSYVDRDVSRENYLVGELLRWRRFRLDVAWSAVSFNFGIVSSASILSSPIHRTSTREGAQRT